MTRCKLLVEAFDQPTKSRRPTGSFREVREQPSLGRGVIHQRSRTPRGGRFHGDPVTKMLLVTSDASLGNIARCCGNAGTDGETK